MKKTFYQLPDEQCERLNKQEMTALRWLIAAENSASHAKKDLEKRLECIPEGKRRFQMMHGQLLAIVNDLIGTTPAKQCKQVQNTMEDMKLSMIPKLTPDTDKVIMNAVDLAYIVFHAQKDEALCMTCVRDDTECRSCEFYQILSAIAPRQDWGSSLMCPYNSDWAGK